MDDDPLPGLAPGDPRNLLSKDARRRLGRAHIELERIRMEAEALIESKGFNHYESQAYEVRTLANLQAAKSLLRAVRHEYSIIAPSRKEYRVYMAGEIESVANSLELPATHRRVLELEFFDPEEPSEADSTVRSQTPERSSVLRRYNDAILDAHSRADAEIVYEKRVKELRAAEHRRAPVPMTDDEHKAERKALRDAYFSQLVGPKIKILDICWATGQHYSEWKRWLRNAVKVGSAPDLAFRAILTSGKRPEEYRKQPRPDGWE